MKWQNILVNINKVTSYCLVKFKMRNAMNIGIGRLMWALNTQHLASETEYFKYYE